MLDLLSAEDMRRVFTEVCRVLAPGGKLCLVSLTHGVTPTSRMVSSLWMALLALWYLAGYSFTIKTIGYRVISDKRYQA